MYSITKPKIMFCDNSIYTKVAESLEELGLKSAIYTMDEQVVSRPHISAFLKETVDFAEYRPEPLKVSNEKHAAFILCSSGTTGPSKGIAVSHASLLCLFLGNSLSPDLKIFSSSSLYWASGVICLLFGTLEGIIRVITTESFSSEHFLNILEECKIDITFSPPSQMAQLLASPTIHKRNLESLRVYLCAGSYMPMSLLTKIQTFMPNAVIMPGYGMTEIPGFGVSGGIFKESGNNGMLNPNVELRIINEEGTNLGPNEQGEILVRTKIPLIGYYGNLKATAENCDAQGWIFTGDIGYMNDEGELFVIDRKKEIYKYNGFKYSPSEIENVIMELPEVAEACVCGIPDIVHTDIPAALIVVKPGACLSEKDVLKHVAERLDSHKHLHGGVYFVDSISKTASGKNLRREAVKICQSFLEMKNKL